MKQNFVFRIKYMSILSRKYDQNKNWVFYGLNSFVSFNLYIHFDSVSTIRIQFNFFSLSSSLSLSSTHFSLFGERCKEYGIRVGSTGYTEIGVEWLFVRTKSWKFDENVLAMLKDALETLQSQGGHEHGQESNVRQE